MLFLEIKVQKKSCGQTISRKPGWGEYFTWHSCYRLRAVASADFPQITSSILCHIMLYLDIVTSTIPKNIPMSSSVSVTRRGIKWIFPNSICVSLHLRPVHDNIRATSGESTEKETVRSHIPSKQNKITLPPRK